MKQVASLLAAAACTASLSGCGAFSAGSGGVAMPEPPAAAPAPGLTASPATPVLATDAHTDSLAALLPDPENRFSTLSSALVLNEDGVALDLAADAYVKTISSDGANGFRVSYVLGGEEGQVHFRASEFWTPQAPDSFYVEMEDTGVRLSSETGSFPAPDNHRGHPDLRYFDIARLEVMDPLSGGRRIFMTYGASTAGDGLPSGQALYVGHVSAQVSEQGGPVGAGNLIGILTLRADFEESTLDGAITGLDAVARDPNFRTRYSFTSRFEVEDGEIRDSRFTARLEGVDSREDAPLDETVRGYEGGMLGEFYGPGAEEFGGVLNARSEAQGRVLAGWFGGYGVATDLELPSGAQSVQSVGVLRDLLASTAGLTEVRVTAVESAPAGAVLVTYEFDGVAQQVQFTESDFDRGAESFARRVDERAFRLETGGGSLPDEPEFDYLDVRGWAVVDHAEDGTALTERHGFAVVGVPTSPHALPAGRAGYSGRMYAESESRAAAGSDTRRTYEGRLELEANFRAGSIEGIIDGIRNTAHDGYDPYALARRIEIRRGTIREGRFSAELNDDLQDATGFIGEMNGQFYGPVGAEVGGVLEGTDHLNDRVVHGWFGGSRRLPDG